MRRIPCFPDSLRIDCFDEESVAMSLTLPSLRSSAIFVSSDAGLTWYGTSVMTRRCVPVRVSSIVAMPRIRMEPRPVS